MSVFAPVNCACPMIILESSKKCGSGSADVYQYDFGWKMVDEITYPAMNNLLSCSAVEWSKSQGWPSYGWPGLSRCVTAHRSTINHASQLARRAGIMRSQRTTVYFDHSLAGQTEDVMAGMLFRQPSSIAKSYAYIQRTRIPHFLL